MNKFIDVGVLIVDSSLQILGLDFFAFFIGTKEDSLEIRGSEGIENEVDLIANKFVHSIQGGTA